MLAVLEEDFRRIPELLGRAHIPATESPFAEVAEPEPVPERMREPAVQLGLF
jgi:hypothetical protein